MTATTISGHTREEVERNRRRKPAPAYRVADDNGLAEVTGIDRAEVPHDERPVRIRTLREVPRGADRSEPEHRTLHEGLGAVTDAAKVKVPRLGRAVARAAARARTAALTISGLGSISYGAYEAHPVAGFITGGVSLLILEWLSE